MAKRTVRSTNDGRVGNPIYIIVNEKKRNPNILLLFTQLFSFLPLDSLTPSASARRLRSLGASFFLLLSFIFLLLSSCFFVPGGSIRPFPLTRKRTTHPPLSESTYSHSILHFHRFVPGASVHTNSHPRIGVTRPPAF